MIKVCSRIIEYSFYSLFLLVPLAFTDKTSELFELNKMWLTWGLTIIIAMAWFTKMILQKKIIFQRTPLDIPIGLFLASQIISTIFSLDAHTSFWGYYSRFNGGLLSTIAYIFLYYALLSNFAEGGTTGRAPDSAHLSKAEGALAGGKVGTGPAAKMVKRLLFISLASGLIVALWGLPSHFGYDPTCFIFRGTFDVSCWTTDFMPKVRIFSTLGQPAWLAAYLAILIPIAIAFTIKNSKSETLNPKQSQNSNFQITKTFFNFGDLNLFRISIFGLLILFYLDLLYTRARSGFLGIWIALAFFALAYFWLEREKIKSFFSIEIFKSRLAVVLMGFLLITFIIGVPIPQLHGLTLEGISRNIEKIQAPKTSVKPASPAPALPAQSFESGGGGTESGDIRRYVWAGAVDAWKANPFFGTGVETFAFAYYKYKPVGQNLTSEWNFLYNKAHNEYLNYLATTGLFGLGTYLGMIVFFLTITLKRVMLNSFQHLNALKSETLKQVQGDKDKLLTLALLASYISILIANFFGFSVVITNIYLFMIPAFIFILMGKIEIEPSAQSVKQSAQIESSVWQWTPIFFILVISGFLLIALFRFWRADIAFALGYNLDRAGEYQQAYSHLHKAVELRNGEPVFKDELSINNAIIVSGLLAQKDSKTQEQAISTASALAQEAINASNEIISKYQNNAVFWKTRTKLFYTLSQVDSRYLPRALDAIEKASLLAPNDANILYNLGVLYGQNNDVQKGILTMEKTITLKRDYRDAYYALGLFYHQANQKDKAVAQMRYILDHLSAKDQDARKSIEDWTRP